MRRLWVATILAGMLGGAVLVAREIPREPPPTSLELDGERWILMLGETQRTERALSEAIRTLEETELEPWWLTEPDEFTFVPPDERERQTMMKPVLNELAPRALIAEYPVRLGRYDHELGGFPVRLGVALMNWRRLPPPSWDPRREALESKRYEFFALDGMVPLQFLNSREPLAGDCGTLEAPKVSIVLPGLLPCSVDDGRRLRQQEAQIRLRLVLFWPPQIGAFEDAVFPKPIEACASARPRTLSLAECGFRSPDGKQWPLHIVYPQKGSIAVPTRAPSGLPLDVDRLALQRAVEEEVQRRWTDLKTRCPVCKARGECPRCKGIKYVDLPCPFCNGEGGRVVECVACRGTGWTAYGTECRWCIAGRRGEPCERCDRRGTVVRKCPMCQTSGICPKCQGTGRVPLP